jgi:hypothetical protein
MYQIRVIAMVLLFVGSDPIGQGRETETPPNRESQIECRFTADVKWIKIIGDREAKAVLIGADPRWLAGLEILTIEKAGKGFEEKGERILAIHSPVVLFREAADKVPGNRYLFTVVGFLENGRPKFHYAEATKKNGPGKKEP